MNLYFLRPDTPNERIFELLETRTAPGGRSFTRFYFNSDKFLHQEIDGSFLSFSGKITQVDPSVAELIGPNLAKLVLTGTHYEIGRIDLFELSLPWPVKILTSPLEIQRLKLYSGTIPSYFFQRMIGIFAGPGTGKTCLARTLSNHLSISLKISCDNCYEYATTHIARYGPPTFEDQAQIFFSQWEREQDIRNTKQVTISDCPHPLSYLYSVRAYQAEKRTNPRQLLWLEEKAIEGLKNFDTKIYLPPNRDRCVKDGIRLHAFEESEVIGNRIKQFLDENNCSYITHSGDDVESLVDEIFSLNHLCTKE